MVSVVREFMVLMLVGVGMGPEGGTFSGIHMSAGPGKEVALICDGWSWSI